MFAHFNRSWELVKASASVLRSDKQLLVFPLVSALSSLVVTATFFVPAVLYALSQHLFTTAPPSSLSREPMPEQLHSPLVYLFIFLFYLSQYSVVFFANTALVGAALMRLRGGKPTVATGFHLALRHSRAILGYALLAATVGMVLRTLSERAGILGRLGAGLIGLAWNVATYLVAPILIIEKVGPVEAVKRSTALLQRTWGEQLVGNAGLGAAFGLFVLLALLLFIPLLIWAASLQSFAWIIALSALFLAALGALLLVQAALSGIYTAAVYLYASEGFTGGPFREEQILQAFRTK